MTLYILKKVSGRLPISWQEKYHIYYSKMLCCYITFDEHIEENMLIRDYIKAKVNFGDLWDKDLGKFLVAIKRRFGYQMVI